MFKPTALTIGTGIAIFGIWLFPVAAAFAPLVNSRGLQLSIFVALVATIIVH